MNELREARPILSVQARNVASIDLGSHLRFMQGDFARSVARRGPDSAVTLVKALADISRKLGREATRPLREVSC